LKEEKLNTKKRRQDAELLIDGKTMTVSLTVHDSQLEEQQKPAAKGRAAKKGMFDNVASSTPLRAQKADNEVSATPQPARRMLRSQSVVSNASLASNTTEVGEVSKRRGRKIDTSSNASTVDEPPKKRGRAAAKKTETTVTEEPAEEVASTSRGRRGKKAAAPVEEEPAVVEMPPPAKAKRGRAKQTQNETVEGKVREQYSN
jgi:hypothetical protein